MLTNLLPGIREFRTPLATGYIWLLTFWLWIPIHFKDTPPTTGVPGDIAKLAHYSGRLGLGIALSFIAYLIGVLSALFNVPLTRLGSFLSWYSNQGTRVPVWGREPDQYGLRPQVGFSNFWRSYWAAPHLYPTFSEPEEAARIALVNARYSYLGILNLMETAHRKSAQLRADPDEPSLASEGKYLSYLIQEVYQQSSELLGKEVELFGAYDRLVAEYQFRIGVGAPLIALFLTLAFRWTPLWLLALLPLLLLLKTGSDRRMEAGDILADAVRRGRMPIATPPELVPEDGQVSRKEPESREEQVDT